MAKVYLQSVSKPENKFLIMSFDKDSKIARLKGKFAEFDEPLTAERLKKYGYKIVKEA